MSDEFADWDGDLDEERDDEPGDELDDDLDDDFDEDLGDEAGDVPESWESEIDDDDLESDLAEIVEVSCPYCGEEGTIAVDSVGGDVQEYVEDCEVCCQPWSVRVTLDVEGAASVEVDTLDQG